MIFLLSPLRDVEGEVTDRPRDLGQIFSATNSSEEISSSLRMTWDQHRDRGSAEGVSPDAETLPALLLPTASGLRS